jgi:hypothetical protein
MVGFFEKRVMAEVERRVNGLWPGINARVVSSAYNSDGLCLRVRVDDDVYVDSTIFNAKWTAMIGADGEDFSMDPDPRLFQIYPLAVGAPPSQVAPAIVNYLKAAWSGLSGLRRAMTGLAEQEGDASGDEENIDESDEEVEVIGFDESVTELMAILQGFGLEIEAFTKADEQKALVRVAGLPDLYLRVVDGYWGWTLGAGPEVTVTELEYDGRTYTIASFLTYMIVRVWHSFAQTKDGAETFESQEIGERVLLPVLEFLNVIAHEDTAELRDSLLLPLLEDGVSPVSDFIVGWIALKLSR